MKRIIFDMGSNSIRMFLAYYKAEEQRWENSSKYLWTTRLGKRNADGTLTEHAMQLTYEAFKEGLRLGEQAGYGHAIALGTGAMREAPNGEWFAHRLQEQLPLEVRIISGELEAEYGFIGASCDFLPPGKCCAVVDLGGATTEVAIGSLNHINSKVSYPIGAVRMKPISDEGIQRVWEETKGFWNPIDMSNSFVGFIGIGGTMTTLAAMDLQLETYDPKQVHGHRITREVVEGLALELRYMSSEDMAQVKGLPEARWDIIVPGIEIVSSLMDAYDIGSIVVSEKDGLEGFQLKDGLKF